MSTYWDLYCKDCNVCITECHINHGEDSLFDLCQKVIPHLFALADAIPDADIGLNSLGVWHMCSGTENSIRLSNLKAHKGHQILPKNEYGEYFGKCGEYGVCPTCGGHTICREPERHDGDHKFQRR